MLKRRAIDPTLAAGLVLAIVFIAVAIIYPLVKILGVAASGEAIPYFDRFLFRPTFQTIIARTIVLGLAVGVVGTLIGFVWAFVQVRVAAPAWLKRALHIIALVPSVSPPFAVAISMIVLFGRRGMISYGIFGITGDVYGLNGMTIVMAMSFFPVVYLTLVGLMRGLDPAMEEASANLGGSKLRTFVRVTLPMLAPGIASSFLLLFVEAIADLGNPLTIGGDYVVLSARLFIAINGEYDLMAAAVLAVILIVPSLGVYLVQKYFADRASVISITGKPTGSVTLVTDPRVRLPLLAVNGFLAGFIVLVYLTMLAGAFTRLLGIDNSFTLNNFTYVLSGLGSEAMLDTTRLSTISTIIAGFLGMMIAFLVVRMKFTGKGLLDLGTMLGIAVPGTIFGIGYLLAFNDPVKVGEFVLLPKLTGGRAILAGEIAIIMVFIIRSTPAGLRAGVAALQQIDPAIEEASVSLGANRATTFGRITLPLIRPAFLSGLIYAFARSMTTISAVIFLTTPETKIMTQQIYAETDAGRFGNAFAYIVLLIGIVLVVIGMLQALIGLATGAERRVKTE